MSCENTKPSGIQEAVKAAGGQESLAEALGVTQQAVSVWTQQGYVPVRRIIQVEALYGVPREKLIDPKLVSLVGKSNVLGS